MIKWLPFSLSICLCPSVFLLCMGSGPRVQWVDTIHLPAAFLLPPVCTNLQMTLSGWNGCHHHITALFNIRGIPCFQKPRTHTDRVRHTLYLSQTHSHQHTQKHACADARKCEHTLSDTHSYTKTHIHYLSDTRCLAVTHIHPHSLALTHTHTNNSIKLSKNFHNTQHIKPPVRTPKALF